MSKFIKGHIPWTKGMYHSDETKEKISKSLLGRKLSEEHKRKISEGSKGSINAGKFKRGHISPNKGKTKETSESILRASIKKTGKKLNCRILKCSYCDKISTAQAIGHHVNWAHLGKKHPSTGVKVSEESKQKNRLAHIGKAPWNAGLPKEKQPRYGAQITQEHILKLLKGQHRRPNKAEKYLEKILHEALTDKWEYAGDGKVYIGSKNPDFINKSGRLAIIELFGDYWHKGENPIYRIDYFKKYGYSCEIVWEKELKDLDTLMHKLTKFERDIR